MKNWGKWKWILAFLAVGLMANAEAGEEGSSGTANVRSKASVKAKSWGPGSVKKPASPVEALRQEIKAAIDRLCDCKDEACADAAAKPLRPLARELDKLGVDIKTDPGLQAMVARIVECRVKLNK